MDEDLIKLCRACGKKNYVFCDVLHEVIRKLLKFVPSLIDAADTKLPSDVCINCYQMIKTLVFNIEGIADMQKILRIQCGSGNGVMQAASPKPAESDRKRSLVEDITKKYTNIKLRKVSASSPEIQKPPKATISDVDQKTSPMTVVKKIIVEDVKMKVSEPIKTPTIPPTEPHRFFMCISCSEKFQKFSQLESHLKSCRASTTQQFKCFCGKVLGSKKDLSTHVGLQHKQNKQQHICTICKKVVTSLSNLQNHMMMHKSPHGTLKGIYMCHVCNQKYPDLKALKAHRTSCKQKTVEA